MLVQCRIVVSSGLVFWGSSINARESNDRLYLSLNSNALSARAWFKLGPGPGQKSWGICIGHAEYDAHISKASRE